jgi:hypothetical protein
MNPNREHCVEFGGTLLPGGSCIIHFYYSPEEQMRFAAFLREGMERDEGIVLAASPTPLQHMERCLAPVGKKRPKSRYERIFLSAEVPEAIAAIVQAAGRVVQYGPARVLVDFGRLVPQEALCAVEGQMFAALRDLPLISLTQYDGTMFTAPVMLEQFHTHELAIVSNAFYQENQYPTSPARYLQMRAAASRR